jgi:two-component system response regulator HydG
VTDRSTDESGLQSLIIPIGVPLSEVERRVILETIRLTGGNKARAARILRIGKKTLYRKLKEYGIQPDEV